MSRLPAERTLLSILPTGAEGGKEFARIVDLLLFYDARKSGGNVTLFNDRSGDTFGLDAFDGQKNGYQYKFFSSPLSDGHRSEIVKSLKSAIEAFGESKIKKWILVTPDDLVNSGRKEGGGDVEWFNRLKAEHRAKFDVEHLGHTKLQALFLQSEPLCLHYYPDIIPNGLSRQSSIQSVRKQYNDNLLRRFGRIEFVGMSVRKEEAARGLPMENIYIPLATVAEGTTDADDKATRTNPLELTGPGQRSVILGDPGTGKSTLLHFLALAGISKELQKRYSALKDDRIALLVTLRRYVDALKANRNLPLIDYIVATVQADFSIPNFTADFILHYLETGRAILLFDGVDELPDLSFKTLVRERVKSMVTSFPGNTAIVTSRIAGYEAEARFSGSCAFDHRQMAPLREAEMRNFALDWHAARTEDEKDRERYVAELMRILTDPESQPIRELARNPLLLTIMVLVHRIDAMLPDERVVLYQKCVETLMVSWQARKAEQEIRRPGKDRADQRHLRRLAAIAQWMHEQAGGNGEERRAVARKADLVSMLRDHIQEVERWAGSRDDAEDEAESFLRFVRERAGLLIEAGADLYSFVHLTFQEYLTARHIIILSEAKGDDFIWEKLGPLIANPRWREVIRLLVAERQSEESKRTLTDKVLNGGRNVKSLSDRAAAAALAGGLLIDRIPAAMERAADIMEGLLVTVAACADEYESASSALLMQLATLLYREENAGSPWDLAIEQALKRAGSDQEMRAGIVLAAFTVPLHAERVMPLMSTLKQSDPEAAAIAEGVLWGASIVESPGKMAFRRLYTAMYYHAMDSPGTNLMASIIAGSLPGKTEQLLAGMMIGASLMEIFGRSGPLIDLASNNTLIYIASLCDLKYPMSNEHIVSLVKEHRKRDTDLAWDVLRERLQGRLRNRVMYRDPKRAMHADEDHDTDPDLVWDRVQGRLRHRLRDPAWRRIRQLHRKLHWEVDAKTEMDRFEELRIVIWSTLVDERSLQDDVIEVVLSPLGVSRVPIWREALRRHFLPTLQSRHTVFRTETLDTILNDLASGRLDETTVHCAACWLLVDTVVNLSRLPAFASHSSLAKLISLSEGIDHPTLTFVRALRRVKLGDEVALETLVSTIEHPSADLEGLLVEAGLFASRHRSSVQIG